MTTLLLDTHTYVWAVTEDHKLSQTARTALQDPSTVLLVSAATAWEMAIKHHAGRWPEAELLLVQHHDLCRRLKAEALPITAADSIRAGGLTWGHTDPFDRMLAAQALRSHATLVTKDPVFDDLPALPVLW